MRSLFSRRWIRVGSVLLLLLAAGILGCAWHFRIWSWRDFQTYHLMSRECHPVWKDLHWGRISAGQDVESVIASTKPVKVDRFGNYVTLSYQEGLSFTGVTIVARNGRLVTASAWSCTWSHSFFDTLPPDEWQAYTREFDQALQVRAKR